MTNAEKYLKEGIDLKEFSRNMFNYLVNRDEPLKIKIENFLEEQAKPTLTEDERVILRNIKPDDFNIIGRSEYGDIEFFLRELDIDGNERQVDYLRLPIYDDLFQFIKERRRIFYRGVVKMIDKLKAIDIPNQPYDKAPGNFELMDKINEIIDKVNELDIKLHTVKLFTPTQDKAVKELLELLETDNSIEELLK